MTWVTIAAAGIGAAGSVGAAYASKDGGGGEGGNRRLNLPSFYQDPYYKRSQEFLSPYGEDILKGDIPDYYKDIGEPGGGDFDNMLAMLTRDVKTGVTEDLARRNIRGGRGSEAVAGAVGDISTKLRWDDYMRSLKGKEFLFGQGRGITEGVGKRGLEEQRQRNAFSLGAADLGFDYNKLDIEQKQAEDDAWAEMLSSGIGAVGNIYGTNLSKTNTTIPRGSAAGGKPSGYEYKL